MHSPPTFDDVAQAAARLEGVAHRTPVLTSRTADEYTGAAIFFKCENLQRTGAFKFRGAYNAVSRAGAQTRGVLAYSSGNHAQAIALAARLANIRATIVMPRDAPAVKVEATRSYGAEIVTYDRYQEDREALAQHLARTRDLQLIPPYDHPDVIAGQGTTAKELIEQSGRLDVLVVCLGGGGLLSGCALAAAALNPGCEIIGIEPEAGNDGQQSLARGEIMRIEAPKTIADGAATTHLGQYTFPIIQQRVTRIETVSDAQLIETMRFFAQRMKLVVEPTGCLATAAVLHGVVPVKGRRVGVIVSGGNVDLSRLAQWLS